MDGLSAQQLYSTPAMAPPPGYTTDFNNPAKDGSNASGTIITLAVLTGLTVVIYALRLYTKIVILGQTTWDDYLTGAATIGAIAYASLVIYLFAHEHFGVHQWNVRLTYLLDATDYLNALAYMYKPFMLCAKLAICIFFLQIFGHVKPLRWAIYFAMAYNTALQTTAFFVSIFICLPGRPSFWNCSSKISELNVITAGFNVFADFYLLLLPLYAVWRLQMHKGRKIGLLLVFFVGILACLASILGLGYRVRQNASPDVTWNFAPEILLVTFELEATIMVGCFMLMPALFRTGHEHSLGSLWQKSVSKLSLQSNARSKKGGSVRSDKNNAHDVAMEVGSNRDGESGQAANELHEYPSSKGKDHGGWATAAV